MYYVKIMRDPLSVYDEIAVLLRLQFCTHCTMYTHCFSISEKTSDEIVMTMLAAGTSGH